MIRINEIENDRHIIVSEDRIKELVVEVYDIIDGTKNTSLETYNQLMKEMIEILRVYKQIPNSDDFCNEIDEVRDDLQSYARRSGILNEVRIREISWA